MDRDVVVIGAGAAGLVAAIRAAERGKRVLLLEKGKKPGVKILMSGGTRCNITHACDARGIVEAFGPNGKFLHSAPAQFGHTIVPPRPALVPLKVNAPWVAGLRGVTLPKIGLKVMEGSKVLASRVGSMLFAHFGLTGPAPLDVSRAVSGHPKPTSLA